MIIKIKLSEHSDAHIVEQGNECEPCQYKGIPIRLS